MQKEILQKYFSKKNLSGLYKDHIQLSLATGIDNLNHKSFEKNLDEHVSIIERKVLNNKYNFTKYKQKLISKGHEKPPRVVSIPTIRDRITLKALCELLVQTYKDDKDNSKFDLPQIIVKKVKTIFLSDKYNGFIKLDVDNFYPSIDHSILLGELKNIIESEYIIELILRAIKTATVSKSAKGDKISQKGVPQGLSISNILATIFLSKIDAKLRSIPKTEYFRYVDDIFILCDFSNVDSVSKRVIRLFKKAGLKIHPPNKSATKSVTGKISSPFEYLGYRFDKDQSIISARKGSKEKLEESLVSIFTSYNHSKQKDADYLLWRLNLRITGCIFQKKGRGWLFYFAEINDETMLHQLDIYVETLTKRFGVNIEPKKFVRSYYEITHSRYDTNYVPNFDKYTPDEMRKALAILGVDTSKLSDIEISYKFHRRLTKEIKDLQTDLQNFRS